MFLTAYFEDSEQTTVSRLLFDASQPELVELGTFAGSATSLEAAPGNYGVAVLTAKGGFDMQLFWVGFAPDGVPYAPRLLADQAFSGEYSAMALSKRCVLRLGGDLCWLGASLAGCRGITVCNSETCRDESLLAGGGESGGTGA